MGERKLQGQRERMVVRYADKTLVSAFKEYLVIGRKIPKDGEVTKTFSVNIWAKNDVVAKSKFWYVIRNNEKLKKTKSEIITCDVVFEVASDVARNFSVFARFDSRTGTHNMCKEFRDVTRAGAVTQAINELGGCHRAQTRTIQIMDVSEVADEKCRKNKTLQFHDEKLKFAVPFKKTLVPRSNRQRLVISSRC